MGSSIEPRLGIERRGASTTYPAMAHQVTGHFRGLVSVAIPDRDHFGMASGWRSSVSIPRAFFKASVALALTSVTFFTTSASGQSPAARPNSTVAVSEPTPGSAENRVAAEEPQSKGSGERNRGHEERRTPRSENCFARWRSSRRILLEQVVQLQRRLDGARQRMCRPPASQLYRRQRQMPRCWPRLPR